jgi:hypothetical protein
MHESCGDVLACIALAVGLFAATFPAALVWAGAEHLLPRWIRKAARSAVLLVFLLICTTQPEVSRA